MFGHQSGGRFGSQCGCLCLESDSTSGVQCDACLAVSLVVDLVVSLTVSDLLESHSASMFSPGVGLKNSLKTMNSNNVCKRVNDIFINI